MFSVYFGYVCMYVSRFQNVFLRCPTPCSTNGRRKIAQNSIELDAKTKESTRKTEEKLD